jgi:hypothetical protein
VSSDEDRNRLITEARHFYTAAPVLLPLLEKRKRVAFDRLMLAHKEGKTDYIALVAELNVINDLEREILTKEQTYRSLEEQNANPKRTE